jgi:hypothetical protein
MLALTSGFLYYFKLYSIFFGRKLKSISLSKYILLQKLPYTHLFKDLKTGFFRLSR